MQCPFCNNELVVICARCKLVHKLPSTVVAWKMIAYLRAAQNGQWIPPLVPVPGVASKQLTSPPPQVPCPVLRCRQPLWTACPVCLRCRLPDNKIRDLATTTPAAIGVDLNQCYSSNGKDEQGAALP
jgi:hypothetical protein